MRTKTTNRRSSSKKVTTNKVKRSLPKYIYTNGDYYRYMKTTNGNTVTVSFKTLKEAKAYVKNINVK